MTGRSNPPPSNTPPVSAAAASNTETTNTTTTSLSIAAVTSQAQTTPQTSSSAATVTTSVLPSTVVTSAIAPTGGASSHLPPICNYVIPRNIQDYRTSDVRLLGGTNRCGEHALLFLCHLFGIPATECPFPVRVPTDDYQYLDLMSPIATGLAADAFAADGLGRAAEQQISCVNGAAQNLIRGLNKTRPYILTTTAVTNGHTVAICFDHSRQCWIAYDSHKLPPNSPVIVIADQNGNLNMEGQRLMPLNSLGNYVSICPMSAARVHFLMRYIFRLRTTHRPTVPGPTPSSSRVYTESFGNFETRILRSFRDEIVGAATSYSANGHVPLPQDFDESMLEPDMESMFEAGLISSESLEAGDPELEFALALSLAQSQGQIAPSAPTTSVIPSVPPATLIPSAPAPAESAFGPRLSAHPCPQGYEDFFGHADLGVSANRSGETFQLQRILGATNYISDQVGRPMDGDIEILVPPHSQAEYHENFFDALDQAEVYMVPFYRQRDSSVGHGWRSVMLLQFVNNEWHCFSAVHGPKQLTLDGGNIISDRDINRYFNPASRLPLDENGIPYISCYKMSPQRFRNIMEVNHRAQRCAEQSALILAMLSENEQEELVASGGTGDFLAPARPSAPSAPSAGGLAPAASSASSSASAFPPQFLPRPPHQQPTQGGQNNYNFTIRPQDATNMRPDGAENTPFTPVDLGRYHHIRTTCCVDQSVDFLCKYFGLPAPQWPDPQNVRNHNALDVAVPLILAPTQGIVRPSPFGLQCHQTSETDPQSLYNFLEHTLDKDSAYLLHTEGSVAYNAHVVTLYFDFNESEWFVFDNFAPNCNGLPTKLTDRGNLTDEGHRLFTPRAASTAGQPPRLLSFYHMTSERTEFMCEFIRRERLRGPTDSSFDSIQDFEQPYLGPLNEAVPAPILRQEIPAFDAIYRFRGTQNILMRPPEANLQLPPLIGRERYTHLRGIGCVEETLDFAARCFGMPVPRWNAANEINFAAALDIIGTLNIAGYTGVMAEECREPNFFYIHNRREANEIFHSETAPILDEDRFYLVTVQNTEYGNHTVAVYFDPTTLRWFAFNNVAREGEVVLGTESFVKPVALTTIDRNLTQEGTSLLCPRQGVENSVVAAIPLTSDSIEFLSEWVRRVRSHGLPINELTAMGSSFEIRYTPYRPDQDDQPDQQN
ncbi:MAG: hypothetical protein ACRCWB_05265 [Enterovibrio sp.]